MAKRFAFVAVFIVVLLGLRHWITAEPQPEPRVPTSTDGEFASAAEDRPGRSDDRGASADEANSGSGIPDPAAQGPEGTDEYVRKLETEIDRQTRLNKALLRQLADGGQLTAEDSLGPVFDAQPVDPTWSMSQEAAIRNEFSHKAGLSDFYLTSVECRETLCRGQVRIVDGSSFDLERLGSLIAPSHRMASAKLETIHLTDDPGFATVYFSRTP